MIFIIVLIAAILAIVNAIDPVFIPIFDNSCKVCGEGKKVGLPDTLIQPSGLGTSYLTDTCGQIEWEAFKTELQGSKLCNLFQYYAQLRCGCKVGVITEPTPKPTRLPTRMPTFKGRNP